MPLKSSSARVYQFLENRNRCFKGLPGLIADALPDAFGNQIINEWFLAHGLSEADITPLDRLCYIGKRAMGALEFAPAKDLDTLNSSSVVQIEELALLATEVFEHRKAFQERLRQQDKKMLDILKVGTSAGGAKPKAIIAYNDATGEVRSGQVKAPSGFGYWLLKFDGGVYAEHSKIADSPVGIGNIEYAYSLMARAAGISMTECRLQSEGAYNHFMTKRFDRGENGEKRHTQTLAGIAHYNRDERYSYEQAFRVMRTLQLPYSQQEEFYRRMAFNVLARNHDDHTKNHSFVMDDKGHWSLSPAYDLCYSYDPTGRWTSKHQMSVNGKVDDFTYDDLLQVAGNVGIANSRHIIESVRDAVSRWTDFAKDAGVRTEHIKYIGDHLLTDL
jgi:serine/threonine-protein kinase HipA